MFKLFIFAAILAFCYAAPAPEAKAKPGFLAAYSAYSAPLVAPAAPALAYSAPAAYYSAAYAAPYAYSPYPAYAAYSAPLIL